MRIAASRFLRRWILPLIGCLSLVLVAGCVESDGPLADPQTASVDESLLGVWTSTQMGTTQTYTIGTPKASDNQPVGMMVSSLTSFDSKTHEVKRDDLSNFVASTINGYGYMSVFANPSPTRSNQDCTILRYRISGDELQLSAGSNQDAEKQLIQSGHLIGALDVNGASSQLEATSASLRQYLQQNSADDLFPASNTTVYHRVTGQPQNAAPSTSVSQPAQANAAGGGSSMPATALVPWAVVVFMLGAFVARSFIKKS